MRKSTIAKSVISSLILLSSTIASAGACPSLEGVYQVELAKVRRVQDLAADKTPTEVGGCVVAGDELIMSPVFSHSLTTSPRGQKLAKAYVIATADACVFEVRTPGNHALTLDEVKAAAASPKGLGGGTTWISLKNYESNEAGNLWTHESKNGGFNDEFQTSTSSVQAKAILINSNGNLVIDGRSKTSIKGWFGIGGSTTVQNSQCIYKKIQ